MEPARRLRALVFQALFLGAVLAFLGFILHNTLSNLESRGISTGFAFLSNEAGFGIIQTLVDYSETSSFGRTFLVGLLNTLLVSALGIVLATVIGFLIGVARLSGNWLISRLAAAYIEIFRNIPLLLQIFFWYFAVLRALPHPRDSLAVGEGLFLNLRGLYLPRPIFEPGFALVVAAVGLALLSSFMLARWARRRQGLTGREFPVLAPCLLLVLVLPTAAFWLAGSPARLGAARSSVASTSAAASPSSRNSPPCCWPSRSTPPPSSRRSCALAFWRFQGSDRSRRRPRSAPRQDPAPRRHPSGAAGDHPTADQPVSESA